MNKDLFKELGELQENLIMAFDERDLGECAEKLQAILKSAREQKQNNEIIENLEKADAAIFEVLCEFEEYEIGGAFAAMVGNNSELRALFKENVQYAAGCIDKILKDNMK